jgi:hypothetical protein
VKTKEGSLKIFSMSKQVDSKDCLLPSFSHSNPTRFEGAILPLLRSDQDVVAVLKNKDSVIVCCVPTAIFIRESTKPDFGYSKLIDSGKSHNVFQDPLAFDSISYLCCCSSSLVIHSRSSSSIAIVGLSPESNVITAILSVSSIDVVSG